MNTTYEQLVDQPRPFQRRQRIALALLLGAAIGVLLTLLGIRQVGHSNTLKILLHAFEGAIVGGICDWYAVVKTYRTVEVQRDSVADAIGNWVANELLSHHVIAERLANLLKDPATQAGLIAALDERLGTRADTEAWLLKQWEVVEPTVVAWGKTVNFDEAALEEIDATFLDQNLTSAMQTCLGTALLGLSAAPELDRLVNVALKDTNWFIKLVGNLNPGRIRVDLARIGTDLRDRAYKPDLEEDEGSPAKILAAALPPLRQALAGYIKGWNELGVEQRQKAVSATLGHLREPLVRAVAELMHRLREALKEAETLMELSLIQSVFEVVEERLDEGTTAKIGEVVTSALKNLSASDFRANLENNTRNYLELIRINGTILGFAVGAGFGLLLIVVL